MTASGSGDEMKPQAWTWSRTHFSPTNPLVTTLVTSPCAGVSLVSLSRKAREKHSADAPVLTRLSCSHHRLSAQSRDQHSTVAGPGSARCGTVTAAGGGGRGAGGGLPRSVSQLSRLLHRHNPATFKSVSQQTTFFPSARTAGTITEITT